MSEPNFEQIARTLCEADGVDFGGPGVTAIAEQLRQVWNARGAADLETLETALAAQHDEIWRDVETHWVRKENVEDLAVRVAELEVLLNEVPPGT